MGAPALLDAQANRVLAQLNALRAFARRAVSQGLVLAPTTPSTQATTTAGALALRINTSYLVANCDGQPSELAAAADYVVHNATFWALNNSGVQAIWAIILDYNSGTVQLADVAGAEALTGAAVAPTDAEITTATGHTQWARIADLTVTRTGDTAVTQVFDHTVQAFPDSSEFGSELSQTEASFSSQPTIPNP